MLIPDVNVLVHAFQVTALQHDVARDWWEGTLKGKRAVGLPWVTVLGFIRIMTNPRIQPKPLAVPDCLRRVRGWMDHPLVQVVSPGEQHVDILCGFLLELGTAGNLTTDAHLAALAIEYRAELVSFDADFTRFPGLHWLNPLRPKR